MKVGIAADHGGYEMKQKIYILLDAIGHQVVDFGNLFYDGDDDYPDFAIQLARAVAAGVVERGVLLCGSGIGASIAANKIEGVRAAVCHDDFSARQGVQDDDMNVLCLGGKITGILELVDILQDERPLGRFFPRSDYAIVTKHITVPIAMALDHAFDFIEQSVADVVDIFDIESFSFLRCPGGGIGRRTSFRY